MASLFRAPAPPPVMAAAPMPDANSAAVQEAQKVATTAATARGGRAASVLGTQGQNGPSKAPVATAASAGDNYGGKSLGATA